MFKKMNVQTSPFQYVLALLPILALGYLLSSNPQVKTNLAESYQMVDEHLDNYLSRNVLTLTDLELEGDKFNKRKVKQYLEEAFSYDDILNLHKTSIDLMETYPKHEGKIQKLTIRVANENGFSFRFHPDDRSIIYRKLTPKEMENILAEEEVEIAEVTPIITEEIETTPTPIALSIKAFPNPTAENITVSFSGNNSESLLTIVDIQGKEIFREKMKSTPNKFKRTIPISKYVKGLATIRMEQNGKMVQQKVIVIE